MASSLLLANRLLVVASSLFTFTTDVAYRLKKPFFIYIMDENHPLIEIPSNLSNCTLFLPYTSYEEEIIEVLSFIEKHGGYVKTNIKSFCL